MGCSIPSLIMKTAHPTIALSSSRAGNKPPPCAMYADARNPPDMTSHAHARTHAHAHARTHAHAHARLRRHGVLWTTVGSNFGRWMML